MDKFIMEIKNNNNEMEIFRFMTLCHQEYYIQRIHQSFRSRYTPTHLSIVRTHNSNVNFLSPIYIIIFLWNGSVFGSVVGIQMLRDLV